MHLSTEEATRFSSNSSPTKIESLDNENDSPRLEETRKRNREHARKTRQRKKARIEDLQQKVKVLQDERNNLKQTMEECSLATILVGISYGQRPNGVPFKHLDRNNSRSDSFTEDEEEEEKHSHPVTLDVNGKQVTIGGRESQVNWKTGKCVTLEGQELTLTQDQLQLLRKERNRLHAKLTRDRKKNLLHNMEQLIEDLKYENKSMKQAISKVREVISPTATPDLSSCSEPSSLIPELSIAQSTDEEEED